ncbi:MAG: integrase core domain-containing protein [Planctomycetota bacterium]
MRQECGWGYTKIRQGLARLGHRVSRPTVKNILVAEGIAPEPNDGGDPDSWSEFLKRHAHVMWQCDFACKKKWTVKGLIDVYFMVFIHLGTRRIWVSPSTDTPTGQWTTQQARNFQIHIEDENITCEIISRDNDRKYTESFDEVFRSTGCTVKRNTPASPNLQAHVERVIQTIKHEILNGFIVVTNQQLDVILRQGSHWYNTRRGHSARDHLPPVRDEDSPPTIDLKTTKIKCLADLGGLLKSYRPAA